MGMFILGAFLITLVVAGFGAFLEGWKGIAVALAGELMFIVFMGGFVLIAKGLTSP